MLDCWKKSCHGATVVPTMAMIKRTDVELNPPCTPGTRRPCTNADADGWLRKAKGISRKLAKMKTNMNRSQRRDRDRDVLAHAEVAEGEADPDELRGDGEEIQNEEVAD